MLKRWGVTLLVLGVGSFILPLLGMQFRILNVFGDAQPIVGIGMAVLGGALLLIGLVTGNSAPALNTTRPNLPVNRVPPPPRVAAPIAARPRNEPSRCTRCGDLLQPGNSFCAECGHRITVVARTFSPPVVNMIQCPHCGATVDPGERFCAWCGLGLTAVPLRNQQWTPPPQMPFRPHVSSHLMAAIVSIFCCWPLAIPAIVFAAQVDGKVTAGDIAGAESASRKAAAFSFIGIGLGLLGIVVYAIILLVAIATDSRR